MSLVCQNTIKHKMELLNLAEELRNVLQAWRVMDVSRYFAQCVLSREGGEGERRAGSAEEGEGDQRHEPGFLLDSDHLAPTYDSGDHLHPNDAGCKALAAAIDLGLFRENGATAR